MLDAVLGATAAAVLVLPFWITCLHPSVARALGTALRGAFPAFVLVSSILALGYLTARLETRLVLTDAGLQDTLFKDRPANLRLQQTVGEIGIVGIWIVLLLGTPIVLRLFSSDGKTDQMKEESRQCKADTLGRNPSDPPSRSP